MYFKSREAAGKLLAGQVAKKYKHHKCAVVALNDGGVMIGMQIAMRLRCVITMLLTENIELPRETTALAGITQDGAFSYNHAYSKGEIEEMVSEYHNFIEQQKMKRLHDMNRLTAHGQLIRRDLLERRNIILVSDGLVDGFTLDLAMEFLKPIRTKKIIVATPLATVSAVDRMHIMADDIYCLNVVEDFMGTDHYYDTPDVPAHEAVVSTIEHVVAFWK